MKVIEPATEKVLAEVAEASVEDADRAVARAKAAYPAWRAVSPGDRAKLLRRFANAVADDAAKLAELEARNVGKPISDARGEVGMVVDVFNYYAGAPERLLGNTIPVAGGVDMTFREPLGVVATQALVSNDVNFINAGGGGVVDAVLGGADIFIVASPINQEPQVLVTKREIKDLAQLKGKKLAVNSLIGPAMLSLKMILAASGLDPERDVSYLAVGVGLLMMRTDEWRRLDDAWLAPRFERLQALRYCAPGQCGFARCPRDYRSARRRGGRAKAPARSLVSIEDVGVATAFLAHDAARLITGETLYIDGGYHIMD